MTLFDLIAVVILLVSGLVGFTRGAVRELVTVFAFTLAALAAVFVLPFSGPLARHALHPAWAGTAAAVVTVFIVAYIALRLIAAWITAHLRSQAVLGTADRIIGLGFGVIRALVVLGVFYLVFNLATPPELVPGWISRAKLYPVARASARMIQAVAPRGLKAAGRFGPALQRAVTEDSASGNLTVETGDSDAAPPSSSPDRAAGDTPRRSTRPNREHHGSSYDKRSRDDIDALVERSR